MNSVTPVKYTTPDGVERELRATLGARKRIAERFGKSDIGGVLQQFGDGALPEIAFAMMYDRKGKAPADLTAAELAEDLAPAEATKLLAHVLSAFGQGKTSPNDIAEALAMLLEETDPVAAVTRIIGSSSSDTAAEPSA